MAFKVLIDDGGTLDIGESDAKALDNADADGDEADAILSVEADGNSDGGKEAADEGDGADGEVPI